MKPIFPSNMTPRFCSPLRPPHLFPPSYKSAGLHTPGFDIRLKLQCLASGFTVYVKYCHFIEGNFPFFLHIMMAVSSSFHYGEFVSCQACGFCSCLNPTWVPCYILSLAGNCVRLPLLFFWVPDRATGCQEW